MSRLTLIIVSGLAAFVVVLALAVWHDRATPVVITIWRGLRVTRRILSAALVFVALVIGVAATKPLYSGGRTFQKEIRYLKSLGYRFEQVGDFWLALPTR